MRPTDRERVRALRAVIISGILAFILPHAGLVYVALQGNWDAYNANPMRMHLLFMAAPLFLWGCFWNIAVPIYYAKRTEKTEISKRRDT